MTGRKMNKVKGAHDTCFCGTPVVCVEKEYQGEARLSWVNEDGTSHYSRSDDGKFSCNIPVIEDPKNKRIDTGGSGQQAGEVTQNAASTTSSGPEPKAGDYIIKDFFVIYRNAYVEAEKFVKEVMYFGNHPTPQELRISAQCIMKSLIPYWIAKTK